MASIIHYTCFRILFCHANNSSIFCFSAAYPPSKLRIWPPHTSQHTLANTCPAFHYFCPSHTRHYFSISIATSHGSVPSSKVCACPFFISVSTANALMIFYYFLHIADDATAVVGWLARVHASFSNILMLVTSTYLFSVLQPDVHNTCEPVCHRVAVE